MDDHEGIWQHIVAKSPAPERDQITLILGMKLIEDNQVRYIIFRGLPPSVTTDYFVFFSFPEFVG
jgi:hypothetical protein